MTDEEIKALVDEFNRKVNLDPEIRSVMQKIQNQDADLDDTSRLFLRRSELMGQFMQSHIPDLAPGERERLCTALLHDGYEVTNEVVPDALRAQDERLGLHLNPVRAPFPWERVQTVSHSLEDPGITEEQRNRRAGAPVANTSMSFHDDSVKENARIRAKLGFKCYLNRVAASGCCKWCTDIAGRYVYGDHPGDIFRRHDNCGCTVTFENGRQRQDVWSKQTWQASPAEILAQYRGTTRLSKEQAEKLQDSQLKLLTKPGQGDIIRTRMATDSSFTLRDKTYSIVDDIAAVKAAELFAKETLETGVIDFSALKNGKVIQPMLERLAELKAKHNKHFFQIKVDTKMDDYTFAEVAPDLSLPLNANYMNSAEATADLIKSLSQKKLLPTSHTDTAYMITHEFMHFITRPELEDVRSKIYKIIPRTETTKFLNKNAASRNACKNVHEFAADALAMVEYGHSDNSVWNKLYQFFFGGVT